MYFFIAISCSLYFYFIYKRRVLIKQAELLNKLLYIEKSPEKYIDEINIISMKFQSERERNINLLQKTTGLFYAGDFEEAINILKNRINKIPNNWQIVYYHNLILSLFFNGDLEEGQALLEQAKETIDMNYNKYYNALTIDLIYAISDFYKGEIIKSKEFFNNLTKTGKNDFKIALGYYFQSKIFDIQDKIYDSDDSMEKARIYGQGSFIEYL